MFQTILVVLYVHRHYYSWLIDNDKDEEGMRVLADLHGGDPKNAVACAEFREIKDRVLSEVSNKDKLNWNTSA